MHHHHWIIVDVKFRCLLYAHHEIYRKRYYQTPLLLDSPAVKGSLTTNTMLIVTRVIMIEWQAPTQKNWPNKFSNFTSPRQANSKPGPTANKREMYILHLALKMVMKRDMFPASGGVNYRVRTDSSSGSDWRPVWVTTSRPDRQV